MTKFFTETGSVYEIDHVTPRVRRVSGNHAATPRQGPDGAWRDLVAWDRMDDGRLLFIWGTNDDGTLCTTLTSPVVKATYNGRDIKLEQATPWPPERMLS